MCLSAEYILKFSDISQKSLVPSLLVMRHPYSHPISPFSSLRSGTYNNMNVSPPGNCAFVSQYSLIVFLLALVMQAVTDATDFLCKKLLALCPFSLNRKKSGQIRWQKQEEYTAGWLRLFETVCSVFFFSFLQSYIPIFG